MAKTKISEFSATPANNTDIDGINIAEGCAPSGINDAIRELMAQLKDWQSGTSNDPYVIGSSGSLTLNQGTANGVPYLNGSKVLTSGSALTFDGSQLDVPAGSASAPSLSTTADANTGIYFPAADVVGISTGGTERARVDASGNLGLGVTPSAWRTDEYKAIQVGLGASFYGRVASGDGDKAGVAANAVFDQTDSRWEYLTTDSASKYDQSGGAHLWYTAASGTAGNAISFTQAMTLDASGNLGIGTSSPSGKLSVAVADGVTNALYVERTGGSATQFSMTFANAYSNLLSSGVMAFHTAGTQRAMIDSSGNLLVGTTSAGSGSSTGLTIGSGRYIWNVGAYNFTTASGANLVVQSDGIFQRSSSAAKYKQDIRDLEAVDISSFRPVRYKSKCQGDDQAKEHFGIVADEVAQAGVEELVTRGSNGEVEGFQYDRFTVVLLKAIQEQQVIIAALTARVEALESN
jgi:hypothetical protein